MSNLISCLGLIVFIFTAFLFSTDRKNINWKTVGVGVLLQLTLGFIILKVPGGKLVFVWAKEFFTSILAYTDKGSAFLFGDLIDVEKSGFIIAFKVLPTIIFMSALMSVLYHIGIMQLLVKSAAKLMMKLMGTSGAESLSAAANIFVGQTEAPLVIKPYVDKMTNSELMALMTGGMATVAGGVLAAYVGLGVDAGHLLAASVMSAPAALVCAKLMVPDSLSEKSLTSGKVELNLEKTTVNLIDAAANGAAEGLKLCLNVGAMLLAFIAMIALLNGCLTSFGNFLNSLLGTSLPPLTFELFCGYLFAPVAFLLGIPWSECYLTGTMLGKKLVINEFVAYLDLQANLENLSPRTQSIMTYALCGFANFSSIAIQIGGIGTISPNRKQDLAKLGIKSLIGGTLACLMTAAIAGIML